MIHGKRPGLALFYQPVFLLGRVVVKAVLCIKEFDYLVNSF